MPKGGQKGAKRGPQGGQKGAKSAKRGPKGPVPGTKRGHCPEPIVHKKNGKAGFDYREIRDKLGVGASAAYKK